jgi:exopolysaccharide biosynthesis polyprenyl glycosylphosphotransferase
LSTEETRLPAGGATTALRPRRFSWFRTAARRPEIPEGRPTRANLRRDSVYRRLLLTADVLCAFGAILIVAELTGATLTPIAFAAVPFVALVSKTIGLYDRDENLLRKTTLDEVPALFEVSTFYALGAWLGSQIVMDIDLTRLQVVEIWALLFFSLTVARVTARRVAHELVEPERCLVIGDPPSAARLNRKIEHEPSLKAHVVGWVPWEPARQRASDPPLLGGLGMLGLTIAEHEIDRVVVAPGSRDPSEVLDTIRLVKSLGVKVSILPGLLEAVGSSVEFDDVEGVVMLGLRTRDLTASSHFMKRTLDIAVSVIAVLLFLPLIVAIAIAIKLDTPGPVLFRQTRIGRDGKRFMMVKFRTMFDGADEQKSDLLELNEAASLFKIRNDPRITRVGRFLRRLSLDELPQLLNVLRGDMSLVGPRPLVPEEDAQVVGWRRLRSHVTPGMTGLWQILDSTRITLEEMVTIDHLYAANWSLWLDVKVLLRTIPYALTRRGL